MAISLIANFSACRRSNTIAQGFALPTPLGAVEAASLNAGDPACFGHLAFEMVLAIYGFKVQKARFDCS